MRGIWRRVHRRDGRSFARSAENDRGTTRIVAEGYVERELQKLERRVREAA
jgi:hypothetical protein